MENMCQSVFSITLPGTIDLAGLGMLGDLQPALAKPQLTHLTRRHELTLRPTFSLHKQNLSCIQKRRKTTSSDALA